MKEVRMNMLRIIAVVIVLVVSLVSCGEKEEGSSMSSNTPEPTATPTDAPSDTPEPTATPTDAPSNTPESTATPTDALTVTSEPTVTPTPVVTLGEQNALKKAKSYLKVTAFSHSGLVKQLEFEGFTSEQAEYGVEVVGY